MGRRRARGSELSDGEWDLLKVVWEREPVTAPDVQERLAPRRGWAYSTVRTMMDRLVAKGALKAEKVRNLTFYRAVLSREDARSREVDRTVNRAFDGALTPLVECLLDDGKISEEELASIERLLRRRRRARQREEE